MQKNSEVVKSDRQTYALLAAALGVVGVGVGLGIAGVGHQTAPGVSKNSVEAIANRAAYNAVAAEKLAAHYTQEISEAARTGETIADMQFLYGSVRQSNGSDVPTEYRDLVVLNINSDTGSANYDANGNFLTYAYLGVASVGPSGDLTISAIPYAEGSTFTAYDPKRIVINVPAYVETGKSGPALYALDEAHQGTLQNPDGSVFSPTIVK